jgi:hypothetical protein
MCRLATLAVMNPGLGLGEGVVILIIPIFIFAVTSVVVTADVITGRVT